MKTYVVYGFWIFLLSTLSVHAQEDTLAQPDIPEKQLALLQEKTKSFPEKTQLSIAIIQERELHFMGIQRTNEGLSSVDNQQAIFEIGSITKVFTASLLADFVTAGKLELDEPIQKHLPFSLKTDQDIHFIHLANHTSGLPRLPINLATNVNYANPYRDYDEEKLQAYLREQVRLTQQPGKAYAYSNLGAALLGYTLSSLSEKSYEALLQERIFNPYHMTQSSTKRNKLNGTWVTPLSASGKETSHWDFDVMAGAGAIYSTTEDLAQFALAQFNPKQASLQLTHQPSFSLNEQMQIGLGWHLVKIPNGREVLWHNGGTGGFTSSIVLDASAKNGIIILSNVSAFHPDHAKIDELSFALLKSITKE